MTKGTKGTKREMTFDELMQDAALRSEPRPEELAKGMGVKHLATFYHKANPFQEKYYFAPHEWKNLIRLTGDFRTLDAFERDLGRVAIPVPEIPQGRADILRLQARAAKEHGEAASELMESLADDGELSADECRRCAREAYEAAQAHLAVYAALSHEE